MDLPIKAMPGASQLKAMQSSLTLCQQIKLRALCLEVTNSIRMHSFDPKKSQCIK